MSRLPHDRLAAKLWALVILLAMAVVVLIGTGQWLVGLLR